MSEPSWYDEHYRRVAEVEAIVLGHFPELLDTASNMTAPVLRVECPRGHQLARVRLEADHNWRPFLIVVDSRDMPVDEWSDPRWQHTTGADPVASSEVGGFCALLDCGHPTPCPKHPTQGPVMQAVAPRVALRCPRCRYDGRHDLATLLTEYVISVKMARTTIALRD